TASAPYLEDAVPQPTLSLKSVSIRADQPAGIQPESQHSIPIEPNTPIQEQLLFDGKISPTRPYFSRGSVEQPVYQLLRPALRNAPATPPAVVAWATLHLEGVGMSFDLEVGRVVHSGPQPVQFIPPVSLTLDRNAQVLPDGTHSLNVDVHTVSEDHPQGELRLHAPSDWTI